MKRPSTYVGQTVYEWSLSAPSQYAMTALAKVCQTLFGTTTTVNGLACTPTSPAGMTVLVGPGEIYQMASLEATACGTLPADTAHQILKQGIQLDTFTSSAFATPGTSGQSIAYLIQAQYADQDISVDPTTGNTPVVLQYYNSTTPSSPWSGPNNSGSTSNTFRDGVVSISVKAGAAATTGSQVTPSPDSGYVGLSVVTVAYGQTTITAANIAAYANAPRLSDSLLNQIAARALLNGSPSSIFNAAAAAAGSNVPPIQQIQSGAAETAVATNPVSVNAIVLTRAIPVTALTDQMKVRFKAVAANTGAVTLNDSTLGAKALNGQGNAALVGGEIVAGGEYEAIYNATAGVYQLVAQSGGAMQVGAAVSALHAPQLQQVQNLIAGVGQCRLSVASSTSLLLSPYNGNNITVNGAIVQLPASGLTLANTGLQSSVASASYAVTGNVVTYTTATTHGLAVGSRVYIEGSAIGANGSYVVTAVPSTTQFSFAFTYATTSSTTDTGATMQPVYYAYVGYVSSTLTLLASQTGYTVQSNGIATMTGDTTKTLVGMFMVNSSGFIDSLAYRWCLNWFNRRPRRAAKNGGSISITQQSNGIISSTLHTRFLMWADDAPLLNYAGSITYPGSSPSATQLSFGVALDATANAIVPVVAATIASTASSPFGGCGTIDAALAGTLTPNEGAHVALLTGYVGTNGGTITLATYQCDISIWG
jgi:hypothetical protein